MNRRKEIETEESRRRARLFVPLGDGREMQIELTTRTLELMGCDTEIVCEDPTLPEMVAAFRVLKEADLSSLVESDFSEFEFTVRERIDLKERQNEKGPSRGFASVSPLPVSNAGQVEAQEDVARSGVKLESVSEMPGPPITADPITWNQKGWL